MLAQALAEVHASVEAAPFEGIDALLRRVKCSPRVFVTGQGRTGLVARAFAMRLAQLGHTAYVVGETITPAIRRGDVLVACSASGETLVTCAYAERARHVGASVVAVTAKPTSRLASVAHDAAIIPSPSSYQLGNSRFEQSLLVLLDTAALALAKMEGTEPSVIWDNHANLE
jgi:6-phospho-3-hexuloisomerase